MSSATVSQRDQSHHRTNYMMIDSAVTGASRSREHWELGPRANDDPSSKGLYLRGLGEMPLMWVCPDKWCESSVDLSFEALEQNLVKS